MNLDHLSATKENTFENCGQQFVYRYIEKLIRPPGVALIRGKAPHKSSEADLKAKLEKGELLEREAVGQVATDYVDEQFKGEVKINAECEGMTVKEARTKTRDNARKLAFVHHDFVAPAIIPTGLEIRVEANFPELPIPYVGILDVVDNEADVRDTKTKTQAPEKNLAHTSEQVTVYWGLFSAYFKRPPTKLGLDVLWVTKGGKVDQRPLWTTRDATAWKIKLNRSLRMLAAVEREIFLPAPVDHWMCSPRWCGYTDVCPYFRGRPRAES